MAPEGTAAPVVTAGYRWRWIALAALLVAEAMNLLDTTIVQVAAPVIHTDLGGGNADIQWFSAAYTLPFAPLLITGGRLGDIAGRKRVFLLGVLGFTLGSVGCALAPTAGTLIGLRAMQGVAAALIIPQTFGLIRAMFDGDELARALGSIGPVMGVAAVCGPALGAVLTHADLFGSSWRAVFLVNVPFGLAVLVIGRWLHEDAAAHRPRLDLTGTGLAVAGISLFTYPLIEAGTGWSAWQWAMLVGGIGVLVAFAAHQRHSTHTGRSPLVEPGLFSNRGFPAALATSTLFFAVMNGLTLVVVLYLQLGLGRDALTAGLTLLPWSAGTAVASWLAGTRLVPRYGTRVIFGGLATLAAGLLGAIGACHLASEGSYPWPLLPALAVAGTGVGLFTVPFFTTALGHVQPRETGSAAGLLNAVQQVGTTLGVAVLGTAFVAALASESRTATAPEHALAAAQASLWLATALLAAATITTVVMTTTRSGQR